jgi:hypothetical protein
MKWEYAIVKFTEDKETGEMEVIRLNGMWMGDDPALQDSGAEFPDFYAYLNKAGEAGWEVINFAKTDDDKTYWYGHLMMKRPLT